MKTRKQNVDVDRNLVRDNWRVLEFREHLERVVLRDDLDVGSLCTALTTDVADAARACFMKGRDEPRKDWISGDSWQLIKWAQILRTDLRVSRANISGMRVAVAFNAWKWTVADDCTADEWIGAVRTSWLMVCAQAAIAQRQLEDAQARKRHSLRVDRRNQWESIASDAQRAADRGDMRELYKLARRLGAFKPTPVPGVKRKDGTLTTDDDEGLARWAEHFATLLGGKQVEKVKASSPAIRGDDQAMQLCNSLDLTPGNVAKMLRRMPRQRAVGPDEIASEIWIAGGDKLAELLCELMKRVVVSGTIPPQWKGGRLARLYKGKGDATDCNSHRGLLIADHASKVFTSLLWPPIARVCDKRLPTEQCGCVRGRGTARVMHTSKLFARRAAAHKRPCALVFADLVKAFDRVLRAVVMGDSSINSEASSGKRVRERWNEAGVPANVVNDAIAYVQMTGGVLSEADLHPGVLHLLRDLHDGTWFQLDGGYLIETNLGSRQGCKFGAIIFNLMYCRALDDLRLALRNENLLSAFDYYPDAAPWCHMACKKDGTPLVASSYEMCDITYVDDECLCLDAGSNDELLEKLPKALDIMQSVFTSHFLELNWKPLKTECVLHLVGRGTKHAWKTIERSAEQRAVAGPGAAKHVCRTPGGIECNVVPCYKHVGSLVDGLGRLECELQARIAAANRVYQPLAKKLMSAKYLDCKTKAQLFLSLVLSVLLYGCETWPEPTQSQGKRLEAFQMRCLRRLAGEPRVLIPGHVRISDVELRRLSWKFLLLSPRSAVRD